MELLEISMVLKNISVVSFFLFFNLNCNIFATNWIYRTSSREKLENIYLECGEISMNGKIVIYTSGRDEYPTRMNKIEWGGGKRKEKRRDRACNPSSCLVASSFTGVPISRIFLQPGRRDALAANKRRCPSWRRPLALQRSSQTLPFLRNSSSTFLLDWLPYCILFVILSLKNLRNYFIIINLMEILVEYQR